MIIHTSLDNIPVLPNIALTIGTFDGVHLGHQQLFDQLKKYGTPVALTFSNHPSEILRPTEVPTPILTLDEKLSLFEEFGIAMAIVIPFTSQLSQLSYDEFLSKLPFTTLIGGEDMRIGRYGEGSRTTLSRYNTIFLPKILPISSRLIREHIKNKQYDQAQKLLGHNKGSLWQASPVAS